MGRGDETNQCGQRKVASEVARGAMEEAVGFGWARRARTGVEGFCLVVEGAEVGWLVGCDGSWEGMSACVEGLVGESAGEPGAEAARSSSSSLVRVDLRLPAGRDGAMTAVSAMVGCVVGWSEVVGLWVGWELDY